jgi:hypothetical protein
LQIDLKLVQTKVEFEYRGGEEDNIRAKDFIAR